MAFRHSEETKRKLSDMRRGERNPFYGRTHTAEFKAARREETRAKNAAHQYEPAERKAKPLGFGTCAYLAGLIDADGSVGFYQARGQDRPYLSIYNTHRPLMEWLVEETGCGSLSNGNMGREQVVQWRTSAARDLHALLYQIRPFMRVKGERADAVLRWLREKYPWAK